MKRAVSLLVAGAFVSLSVACSDDDATPVAPVTTVTAPAALTTVASTDATTTSTAATTTTSPTTVAPTTTLAPIPGYPAQPADVPFPTADWPTGPLPAGVDQAAIDAAVDTAFGAPDAQQRVRSVVVVNGGRIVYERYHPLDGPDEVMPSYSVAKSFTATVVGLLVGDGRLSLDEHPPRPEWSTPGDPRQSITLRQLLQMSSGLQWTEEYSATSLLVQMLAAPSAAALMAEQPLAADPGTVFNYSTGTSALIAGIAADQLGGCAALTYALTSRLLQPLGITTESLTTDGGGCVMGGFGIDMTTRDFARFGLLYLRGGQWDGHQVLSPAWVVETRRPAPTQPAYGLHFWLAADGTAFSAEGLFGQRIVIVPGRDVVIATTSTNGGQPGPMVDTIVGAFPAAQS